MKIVIALSLISSLFADSITVYNSNFAQVIQTQKINLKKGRQSIKFGNLPNSLIPDSVAPSFKSGGVKLISQSYKNNPLETLKLLEANLNKTVKFYDNNGNTLKGTLVNIAPNIIKIEESYYIVDNKSIIYAAMPADFDNKPYIVWDVESNKEGESEAVLRYLINNISWSGNYTVALKDKTLDLKLWANIINSSGKSFKDANVNLIAGDVDRGGHPRPVLYKKRKYAPSRGVDAVEPAIAEIPEAVAPGSISGYHIYKLPHKISLLNNQAVQVLLLDAKDIKFSRFALALNSEFSNYGQRKLAFKQVLEFKNSKENSLGTPLPSGLARVYKKESYIGSYYIANTPSDENITLEMGKYFDITGTKTVTKFKISKNLKDVETEYTIKNRGDKEVNIKLYEKIPQGSKIKFSTTCKEPCFYKKKNALAREFDILLKPNSEYKFKTESEVNY